MQQSKENIKSHLIGYLREWGVPWEYSVDGGAADFPDDFLIEWILKEGELKEILSLFKIYDRQHIHNVLNSKFEGYYGSWRDFYNWYLFEEDVTSIIAEND